MSTSKKKSATLPAKNPTPTPSALNGVEATVVNNKNLPGPAAGDELDEAIRKKTSPQNYFYARAGAFAEGVYTEF